MIRFTIEPGGPVAVMWQGKPVWVVRRSLEVLEGLSHDHLRQHLWGPDSEVEAQQPAYAKRYWRRNRRIRYGMVYK